MPGVSFIGGKLSVIGGYSWPGGVDLIEQWDDDNEEWIKITMKIKHARYDKACLKALFFFLLEQLKHR